jgi:hypothetical protein
LLGGAYALREHGGIIRDTKDLDLFCKTADYPLLLRALADVGYRTALHFAGWLARAYDPDPEVEHFIDVIFGTPNGVTCVDDDWFTHATEASVLGVTVRLVPPEELIVPKMYLMERERFDGADVLHVLRLQAQTLDWRRVWARMEAHWEVLFAHLLLFQFVYPSERERVPEWLWRELLGRQEQRLAELADRTPAGRVCRGLLISDRQYQIDVTQWGYIDGRAPLLGGGGPWT